MPENTEAKFTDKFDNLYVCHPSQGLLKIEGSKVVMFDAANLIAVVVDDDGDELVHCGMAMTAEKLKAK